VDAHLGAAYQMTGHTLAKSFCFFAAGLVVMVVKTQDIASVRGLARTSPLSAIALVVGGFAIAGAPPFAIFVSELSIIKAGLVSGQYLTVALLSFFVVVAFCAVMFHINRMAFAPAEKLQPVIASPATCRATLAIAGLPLLVIGIYIPGPLRDLLLSAAKAMGG
jgi:hydrogenase-4 component F